MADALEPKSFKNFEQDFTDAKTQLVWRDQSSGIRHLLKAFSSVSARSWTRAASSSTQVLK